MKSFEGRVAVVTGAASGIGRALAERAADEGMKVVVADVEGPAAQQVAKELAARGAETLAVETDVAQPDALSALAERTVDAFGAAHLLCNNAGVFAGGLSWEAPLTDYEWVFSVNVWGVLHGLRSFTPILLEQDEAHVVNTASMAGLTALPFNAPYTMSKHAVVSLSETFFLEMEAREANVGVSVLCPEVVATRIGESERNRPEHLERNGGAHPERELVEASLRTMIAEGLPPAAMADRVFAAIREQRFYVLPPEPDRWRTACNARLDWIREARNPGMAAVPDTPGE